MSNKEVGLAGSPEHRVLLRCEENGHIGLACAECKMCPACIVFQFKQHVESETVARIAKWLRRRDDSHEIALAEQLESNTWKLGVL